MAFVFPPPQGSAAFGPQYPAPGATREDINAFLGSPMGNRLPASAWNDLMQRAGSAPSAWHALAAMNQQDAPQAQLNISTGTGETQKMGYDPSVASRWAQQYFTPQQAPSPQFQRTFPGVYGSAAAPLAQPFSMEGGYRNAMNDPEYRGMNGVQRLATLTAAAGYDPYSWQKMQDEQGKRHAENVQAALKMQQEAQTLAQGAQAFPGQQRAAALARAHEIARSINPDTTPEDIIQSYGKEPTAPNTIYIRPTYGADPLDPTKPMVRRPEQRIAVDPGHIQALRQAMQEAGMISEEAAPAPAGQAVAGGAPQASQQDDAAKMLRAMQLIRHKNDPERIPTPPLNFGGVEMNGAGLRETPPDLFAGERALQDKLARQKAAQAAQLNLMEWMRTRPSPGPIRTY